MILTYVSGIAKDIFEGNWSVFAGYNALGHLEECFIDLRILDAAATHGDLRRAFNGRLETLGVDGDRGRFAISQPASGAGFYRIEFAWRGNGAENVEVKLSPRT